MEPVRIVKILVSPSSSRFHAQVIGLKNVGNTLKYKEIKINYLDVRKYVSYGMIIIIARCTGS